MPAFHGFESFLRSAGFSEMHNPQLTDARESPAEVRLPRRRRNDGSVWDGRFGGFPTGLPPLPQDPYVVPLRFTSLGDDLFYSSF